VVIVETVTAMVPYQCRSSTAEFSVRHFSSVSFSLSLSLLKSFLLLLFQDQIQWSPFRFGSMDSPPLPLSRVQIPTESPHDDPEFHWPAVGAFLEHFNLYHS
jgi:hypothetical protein